MTRATLHVFVNMASNLGANHVNGNARSELTINYGNAPAIGSVLESYGVFGMRVWTAVDIMPMIAGYKMFCIVFTTTNATAFRLGGREAGVKAPQLVIGTTP